VELFAGSVDAAIDAKNRVSLPAKYRRLLPEDVVLVRSPSKSFPALFVYTEVQFKEWFQNVLESMGDPTGVSAKARKVRHKFFASAEKLHIDSVGRILIPAKLASYAQIDKDVVISGEGDYLSIIARDVAAALDEDDDDLDDDIFA
jgi:MraZ protein